MSHLLNGERRMETPEGLALFRAERDALAFLGVISSLHLRFDPPISAPNISQSQPMHLHGLNVRALVIDKLMRKFAKLNFARRQQRAMRARVLRTGPNNDEKVSQADRSLTRQKNP